MSGSEEKLRRSDERTKDGWGDRPGGKRNNQEEIEIYKLVEFRVRSRCNREK